MILSAKLILLVLVMYIRFSKQMRTDFKGERLIDIPFVCDKLNTRLG